MISHQALKKSLSGVDETYEMFDNITHAAEGATSVQTEISQFINTSKTELMQHINTASKMGTTKSAMFEDIDNMLSQIPPIIKDYTGE